MEAKTVNVQGMVTIGLPMGKATVDVKKANDGASAAKGVALGEVAFGLIVRQFGEMKRVLRDLYALDNPGRVAFRVTLKGKLHEQRKWLKDAKASHGAEQVEQAARALRSLTTRTSQLEAVSTAYDRGWRPEFDAHTFPVLCSQAVDYNRAHASSGPTRRKGRPETPFLDKLKKFLNDNAGDNVQLLQDAATMCETMVKIKGAAAPL